MKTIILLLIIFLGACCYPAPKPASPTISIEERMKLVSEGLQETSEAVDILSDDSLSVEERMRLYLKRMEEINNKLLETTK